MLINIQPLMRSTKPYWVQLDATTELDHCEKWDAYERNFCVGTPEVFGVYISPANCTVTNGLYSMDDGYEWGDGHQWGVLYETVQSENGNLSTVRLSASKLEIILKRKGYNSLNIREGSTLLSKQ